MEYTVIGWPEDEPTLRLDHRQFAYAGKFVMSNSGKAVVRGPRGTLLSAVAFNADRTDDDQLRLRYITTRNSHRGQGIGTRLASFITARAHERAFDTVTIAVNNPFAFHALSKAGFGFTGEQTGMAELVLEHPHDRSGYQSGLDLFRERDLSMAELAFLQRKADSSAPTIVPDPSG